MFIHNYTNFIFNSYLCFSLIFVAFLPMLELLLLLFRVAYISKTYMFWIFVSCIFCFCLLSLSICCFRTLTEFYLILESSQTRTPKRLSVYCCKQRSAFEKIDDRVKITYKILTTWNCFTEHLMLRLLNWIRLPNGEPCKFKWEATTTVHKKNTTSKQIGIRKWA